MVSAPFTFASPHVCVELSFGRDVCFPRHNKELNLVVVVGQLLASALLRTGETAILVPVLVLAAAAAKLGRALLLCSTFLGTNVVAVCFVVHVVAIAWRWSLAFPACFLRHFRMVAKNAFEGLGEEPAEGSGVAAFQALRWTYKLGVIQGGLGTGCSGRIHQYDG